MATESDSVSIKRGDIYYADLSPVVGSEQGGVRPVLVVQNDIGNKYSPTIIAAAITSKLNNVKSTLMLVDSELTNEEILKIKEEMTINRTYLTDELDENYELASKIGEYLIPAFILPFFFLILMVTQMIGAEINEEKSSKSMEVIISSVSPKTHFLAKLISSNIYAILQGVLLIVYIIIGLFIRVKISGVSLTSSFGETGTTLINNILESGILDNLLKCLPFIILMILLSFVAYSLFAGILASMTTSQEDFSQLQTPLMIFIMLGYFLSIMASSFEKSSFIIVVSVIPFISCILSPVLLSMGQIGLLEVGISIALLVGIIYLLIKYGLKIYKAGILNYSSDKLWKKMFDSVKRG